MSFDDPFLFWGTGYDADRSVPHVYEVRFASFIPFVDRPALAKPFERAMSATYDEDVACRLECEKWLWSLEWVLLRFSQSDPSVSEGDYAFSTQVDGVLETLHEHAPIAEAVALDAPAGWSWPWHDETVAQQAMPSDGPSWKNRFGIALPGGVYATRPRFEAETLFDEDFEAERRRWREHYVEMDRE